MEENVRKELEVIRGMVLTWKQSYLGSVPGDGGGEFLAEDFLEDIENHVSPYVRRLFDCQHLTGAEVREFLDFCYQEVENLRQVLADGAAEPFDTIWPEGREKEGFSAH
jgi:hypothetical protein